MTHLPKGWEKSTLGAIGEYLNGRGFKKSEWSDNGLPIIRIQNLTGSSDSFNYFAGTVDERYRVKPGDLLVSWAATLGAFIWNGPTEGWLNQHIFKVRSFVDKRFHYHLIEAVLNDLRRKAHGGGMVHITRTRFDDTEVRVPPLPEQRRIVAKIEELFSELDAGVEALERAQARLERFRASVLKAAIEGRLTERWRAANPPEETGEELLQRILDERRNRWEKEQLANYEAKGKKPPKGWRDRYTEPEGPDTSGLPELPGGWCYTKLGTVASLITKGTTPTTHGFEYQESGVRYIRTEDLSEGRVATVGTWIGPDAHAFLARSQLEDGDVLFSIAGTIGKTAIVDGSHLPANTNQALAIIRGRGTHLLPQFLQLVLRGIVTQRVAQEKARGGAMNNISLGDLKALVLPIPPVREQVAIVYALDVLHSRGVEAAQTNPACRDRARRLRQAILKRAFEGRLVPQDPNDEPASALLERIRAERNGAGPRHTPGKKKPNTDQQRPEL